VRLALVYPEVYDLARFRENRKEFPPFGPLYLAAAAEEAGHEVAIFKVSPGQEKLDLRGFGAIGYSLSSSATYGIIRRTRQNSLHDPGALLMAGGVHANFYPERTLLDLDVDVVGVGEGEETIVDLLEQAQRRLFESVPGVCYVRDGRPVLTSTRVVERDIDHLPLPARHLLPAEDLVMSDRLAGTDLRMAHTMFSRGCPFKCRFCAVANTVIQYRSGLSARQELEHLKADYDIDGFAIVDDNFIINRHKVIDICQSIADLELQWSALSRVNTVNAELLTELRRAGCIELKFGMESGSSRILEAMRKNIRPEQIRDAVRAAKRAGINVKLFLVHGYPGEDVHSSRETITLLRELAPMVDRASLFRFVPLPGTYVYDHPDEFSLRGTDRDPDWDGDWSRYHIHHNHRHWWGDEWDFASLQQGYEELSAVVDELWPERHAAKAPLSTAA
jgi:anaerobic magnesium-protoporphyrin IX monomethyl ester cyclase